MELHVTTVNGNQFVSGLRWHKLKFGRTFKAEAKKIAKREGWDMVTIRRTKLSILAGFAPRTKQGIKGMYSLASALATQLGDNWVGAFKVGDNKFALAAVYQGSVMPGFDRAGTFDEIDAAMRECYGMVSSGATADAPSKVRTIAPVEFGFASEHLELAEVLGKRAVRRDHKLRPVSFGMTKAEVLMLGAAAVVVLGGGSIAKSWWTKRAATEELARQQRLEAERAKLAAASANAPAAHPWASIPRAEVVIDVCMQHLDTTELSIGGWVFTKAVCKPSSAEARYVQTQGVSKKAFDVAVKALTGAPAGFDTDAGVVAFSRNPAQGEDEQLRPLASRLIDVSSQIEQFDGASLSLSAQAEIDSNAPAGEAANATQSPWGTRSFEIKSLYAPGELFVGMDTAGIRINSIETVLDPTSAELTYTLKGEIYGLR